MTRSSSFACLFASLLALSFAAPAFAEEAKPDDTVAFDLVAEDWVTTKTSHVVIDAEAAIMGSNAASARADMIKAVNDIAKGDWRLVSFNRGQDQTGLERWSANFESRLPESELGGLADAAKKASKAGLQLTVSDIDFSPTLEENEAARAALRTKLLKEANDQLATLNSSLPGRNYRIAQINFGSEGLMPMPRMAHPRIMASSMAMVSAAAPASTPDTSSLERSEKITLSAHIVYAALPQSSAPAAH